MCSSQHCDLGVIFSGNLSWSPHLNSVISRTSKVLFFQRRSIFAHHSLRPNLSSIYTSHLLELRSFFTVVISSILTLYMTSTVWKQSSGKQPNSFSMITPLTINSDLSLFQTFSPSPSGWSSKTYPTHHSLHPEFPSSLQQLSMHSVHHFKYHADLLCLN